MIQKKDFYHYPLIFLIGLISVVYEIEMMYPEPIIIVPSFVKWLLVFLIGLFAFYEKWPWKNLLFRVVFLLEVGVYFLVVEHSLLTPLSNHIEYAITAFPLGIFLFSYVLTKKTKNTNSILFTIFGVALLFVTIYFFRLQETRIKDVFQVDSASYTALYLLPIILSMKGKLIKIIGSILIFIAVFVSFKRGGLVCWVGGICAYLVVVCWQTENLKERSKRVLGTVIALFFLAIASFYFNEFYDNFLFDRFSSIAATGGSGRDGIYERVIEMIQNTSFVNFFIGAGYNRVIADSGLNLSAHNDFLECLYDYGFLIFLLYLSLYVMIFRELLIMLKKKSVYAAPMAASLAMFFLNSMISHIFLYERFFMMFMFFWGFILAAFEKEQIKSLSLNVG